MPPTFDLVLSKGIVINQDGQATRDIGDLSGASARETIADQTPEYPAWCKALILPAWSAANRAARRGPT